MSDETIAYVFLTLLILAAVVGGYFGIKAYRAMRVSLRGLIIYPSLANSNFEALRNAQIAYPEQYADVFVAQLKNALLYRSASIALDPAQATHILNVYLSSALRTAGGYSLEISSLFTLMPWGDTRQVLANGFCRIDDKLSPFVAPPDPRDPHRRIRQEPPWGTTHEGRTRGFSDLAVMTAKGLSRSQAVRKLVAVAATTAL